MVGQLPDFKLSIMAIDKRILILHPNDHVAIALTDLPCGEKLLVNERFLTLRSAIPFGHKIALMHIMSGTHILKYGLPIGIATNDIEEAEWVHSHNLKSDYIPLK